MAGQSAAEAEGFSVLRRHLDGADIVWAHSSFSVLFARLLSTVTAYELIVTYHGSAVRRGPQENNERDCLFRRNAYFETSEAFGCRD